MTAFQRDAAEDRSPATLVQLSDLRLRDDEAGPAERLGRAVRRVASLERGR